MNITMPPWANGPFELLLHAEGHHREGEDFDRRIALISFDNAIEVAITTYLTLNPILRGGRSYQKADLDKWLINYHTKLEFLDVELSKRGISWQVRREHIIWAHTHRNEQYHGGQKGTPEKAVLKIVRDAALWVFSILFDIADAELALEQAIRDNAPPTIPSRDNRYDIAIDAHYGIIVVGEEAYYTSEILFAVDHTAYLDVGQRLCAKPEQPMTSKDIAEQA